MKNTPKLEQQLLHIVAAKTEEIERLEKTIDKVTTDRWDLQDRIKRLETELEIARCQFKGIHELQQSDNNEELKKYQEQVSRLLKERVDFDCQLTGSGKTGSLCGGCLACQLKQSHQIIEQTSVNVKKRNEELEALQRSKKQSNEEYKNMLTEVGHLKNILRLLIDAMGKILDEPFWKTRTIAEFAKKALDERMAYLTVHKIYSLDSDQ